MEIEISKFKRIDGTSVELGPLNIFIGANNTGKSSFIQGIQFATSACQTLELQKCSWTKNGVRTLSLDSAEFMYSPTKDIASLYHGRRLTGARVRNERVGINFKFKENGNTTEISISKGKNGGFTTSVSGRILGEFLSSIKSPFCVYVPGIAGIPTEEKYEVPIAVRKSATRGDSNNYLRNIIYGISKDEGKWRRFISSVKKIYGNELSISVDFDENKSEFISVNVTTEKTHPVINSETEKIIVFEDVVAEELAANANVPPEEIAEPEDLIPENVAADETEGNRNKSVSKKVATEKITFPLDTVGTGLLQVIQIFAYIEYFDPKIILLDEPDAHIHPTKQRLLAKELAEKAEQNKELKIVFSTHSRYILDSLEGRANVAHFQDGVAYDKVRNSSILIDIGAADADHLFGKKTLKYVIATEDKVDSIEDKKEFLKKFLLANGMKEEEVVLHSYEGCKKVHFAKILEGFVAKHIPGARVILHIDRDQKTDDDPDFVKLRADCNRDGIALFITKFQEIESYFCLPEHINELYGIPVEEAQDQYNKMVDELKEETLRKLSNFILRERPKLSQNEKGQPDIDIINELVDSWYAKNKYEFTPGKELLGKTKRYLQDVKKFDPNIILSISDGLKCNEFSKTLQSLVQTDA
jgi:AAA15 family ATPase/GTPase